MKVSKVTGPLGRFGVTAEPEDYDGTPSIGTLWFDRQPRVLHHDRFLLGSYLAFGHCSAGRIDTGRLHSPALVEAIRHDAAPVWLQVPQVELYAKAIPRGSKMFHVDVEGLTVPGVPKADGAVLAFNRSDNSVGASVSGSKISVPTNAHFFAAALGARERIRVALACGVLYAEELNIDAIELNVHVGEEVVRREEGKLRDLLSTVGLGVRFMTDA